LVQRLVCTEAMVDSQRLRSGFIDEYEWDRISKSFGVLSEAPIYIDDTAGISALELRTKARRLKAEANIQLIIVDYLQLIQGRGTALAAFDGTMTPEAVFAAARAGDEVAQAVVARTVEYLAIGLSNLVHLLNPRRIGLGGGVMRGGADLMLDPLRRETAARCGPWVDVERLDIVLATLDEDAPLLGVARNVWAAAGATTPAEVKA
jgi:predicted NBD/HSP70 family sugar kinase